MRYVDNLPTQQVGSYVDADVRVARRFGRSLELSVVGQNLAQDHHREFAGGTDEGPSPTRLVAAALAACTAITVEMYADRKGWDLGELQVEVEMEYDGPAPSSFEVVLHLPGGLSEEQNQRLLAIAGKCPVHRVLAHETDVTITDRVAPA